MSLRKTLYTMLIVMTVLPVLLFTFFEYQMVNNRMILLRQSALQELAVSEGHELKSRIMSIQSQIWGLTRNIVSQPGLDLSNADSASDISKVLASAVTDCGYTYSGTMRVTDLFLLDAEGRIVSSANQDLLGRDILGTSLHNMLSNEDFYMSALTDSDLRGSSYGVWVTRRFDNMPDVVLAAFIDSQAFCDRLMNIYSDQSVNAYLFSGDNIVRAYDDPEAMGRQVENSVLSSIMTDYQNGLITTTGYNHTAIDGVDSIYSYYVLPDMNCGIVITQDAGNVMKSNRNFLIEAALASSLFVLLSLMVFVPYLKRSVINPIFKLRDSMNMASVGEYRLCNQQNNNEIGELISGFNHMVTEVNSTFTSLNEANEALRKAEEHSQRDKERIMTNELRFKCATELSTIVVFELMPFTDEFFCSDSWESITTYPRMDIFPREYVVRYIIHPEDRAAIAKWSAEMEFRFDEDIRFLTAYGDYKWIHISMAQIEDQVSKTRKIIGTITDIHENVLAQERANYAAYHETLTGLPRRILFAQDVEDRLDKVRGNNWGVVYVLSMDSFKRINDIYGFSVGDQVICTIAASLRQSFESDMYLARNSGNSFLLYMECPRIMSYVNDMADQMIELFSRPFEVGDLKIEVPVHLGAAMYPDHGRDVNELIRNADIAMHEAREQQLKSRYSVFDSDMLYKVERTHQIMEVLRNFNISKAMYIQYQPIVRASDRSCLGFEALVRMDTSPIGFISPVEFIPLAEQSKLIIPIGMAVLRESCTRTRELLDDGYDFDHVSVNVSSVQLEEPDFVDMVLKVLSETGLPNNKLQLEVTESLMIENLEDSIKKLRKLQNSGITIALDDFGTGYSSMKYLRSIPLDVIKIDKHFIDEIELGVQKLFVFTMIQLSHDIGLSVVAEGVETERQLMMLKEHGCDYIQGFCVSRPLYSHDIERFLDSLNQGEIKNLHA